MSGEEQVPDPLANFDQALRGLVDVARLVRAYYESLRKTGFNDEQAMMLTSGYQVVLWAQINASAKEADDD